VIVFIFDKGKVTDAVGTHAEHLRQVVLIIGVADNIEITSQYNGRALVLESFAVNKVRKLCHRGVTNVAAQLDDFGRVAKVRALGVQSEDLRELSRHYLYLGIQDPPLDLTIRKYSQRELLEVLFNNWEAR